MFEGLCWKAYIKVNKRTNFCEILPSEMKSYSKKNATADFGCNNADNFCTVMQKLFSD